MINKKILIIGGTGSLGQAITNRLMSDNQIILFSRDELKQWTLRQELNSDSVRFEVGDMRDISRVSEVLLTHQPNIVIIAAALKQVDTCELAPSESIKTNILGVENLVNAVDANLHRLHELEAVLMVSTDKACAPTNVYGMSKAIAERVVVSRCLKNSRPKYLAVRYGNVLESRGSIIPLFRYQAENASRFTLTHPDMTRYLMTLDDSINLILKALNDGESGSTWLPKLRSMRIRDLAQIFSEMYGKPVEEIGLRPGEKLHEDLISEPESVRVCEVDDFFVIAPAFEEISRDVKMFHYASDQNVLSYEELKAYLTEIGMLRADIDTFQRGPHVDEIRRT